MLQRPKCPHCGSAETIRSHRRFFERLLLIWRPYSCDFCNHRFLVLQARSRRAAAAKRERV